MYTDSGLLRFGLGDHGIKVQGNASLDHRFQACGRCTEKSRSMVSQGAAQQCRQPDAGLEQLLANDHDSPRIICAIKGVDLHGAAWVRTIR
jgi:hypothetical protein